MMTTDDDDDVVDDGDDDGIKNERNQLAPCLEIQPLMISPRNDKHDPIQMRPVIQFFLNDLFNKYQTKCE